MKKILIITLVLLTVTPSVFAQEINTAKLDEYFDVLNKNNRFMGSVAIAKDGKILYSKAIGYTDIAYKIPATTDTKYRIGSISKTYTAAMIMKAIEEKKLTLETTLDRFYPGIKNASTITIENLLNHSSGIHNFTNDDSYYEYYLTPKTEAEMIKIITDAGSDFEPNIRSSYSNSGYVVLSYILEKVYNTSYAQLLNNKLVKPYQLNQTLFSYTINNKNNEALSYKHMGGWQLENDTHMSIPLGAGGISATPQDILKFGEVLFNEKFITKESLEHMKKITNGYGLGLFQLPYDNHLGYGHTGGIDGFSSVFGYFPDTKVSFAVTSNGVNMDLNKISIALLAAVFGDEIEIPVFSNYSVDAADLEKYVGVYASPMIPMKLTFTIENNTLMAQGTNQPKFAVEAIALHNFKFEQARAEFIFKPTENTVILIQGGQAIPFIKE
jgi:D-alanyl-D-alanine carboxypeptidase